MKNPFNIFFESKRNTATLSSNNKNDYVLVSMYAGDQYYYRCADILRKKCREFGIECDFREVKVDGKDWIDICREKIKLYKVLLKEHKKPIFWIDVDTELLKAPVFPKDNFDIGIFMRGFSGLNTFSSIKYTRKFEPGYLFFNYNKKTLDFLTFLESLEKKNKKIKATDDYFLQDAFEKYDKGLRFLILSRDEIKRNKNSLTDETCLLHGDSGNVKLNKGIAKQHSKEEVPNEVKKQIFMEEAVRFIKKGDRVSAIIFYELALKYGNSDMVILERLYKLHQKEKSLEQFEVKVRASNLEPNVLSLFLKLILVDRFEAQNFDEAHAIGKEIVSLGDERSIDFYQSKSYRYGFDQRASLSGVDELKRVKMFWWEQPHPGNFGDVLSPYLIEKLTNIPPKFVGRAEGLLAIGSIIKWASDNSHVWGSGTSSKDIPLPKGAKYHAVRGPYTRNEVLKNGGECPEVYGDPAWLLPAVVEKSTCDGSTGLVLHYIHEDGDIKVESGIKRIPIKRVGIQEIEDFLIEFTSCKRIISTSLHGVIIANAYGIPVIWATVSNSASAIHGDGIKFKDYFLSIGIDENLQPIDLTSYDSLDDKTFADEMYWLPKRKIDTKSLLLSAPFLETVDKKIIEKC
jgi:hypothetical protein